MKLEGSCHCGAVRFKVASVAPYPYMRCYCSICRKTAGGGGYSVNLMGDSSSMEVAGGENISVYRARLEDGIKSSAERRFCRQCGSYLWLYDPHWPQLVHPFASAIDSELPQAPERNHIMLLFKPAWVDVPHGPLEHHFDKYPDDSIVEWHATRGLLDSE